MIEAPRLLALVKEVRDQIGSVAWYAPREYKSVHQALEQLRTDADLPAAALEHVIRAGNYAGMLLDLGVLNENDGPDVIQADVRRELDALERLLKTPMTVGPTGA